MISFLVGWCTWNEKGKETRRLSRMGNLQYTLGQVMQTFNVTQGLFKSFFSAFRVSQIPIFESFYHAHFHNHELTGKGLHEIRHL